MGDFNLSVINWEYHTGDTNPELVWDLLLHLDAYKSMERDGIHAKVLKAWLMSLWDVSIFQQSLESGEVPIDWKLSNVVLVFEVGKKEVFGNYSPVSVTLVPCKIREKIVLGHTEKHLKDSAVIDHSLSRFTRGKSCLTILIFYDKVTHLVDQGKPIDIIFSESSNVYCFSQCPSGQNVQHTARQKQNVACEQLADGLGTDDCL